MYRTSALIFIAAAAFAQTQIPVTFAPGVTGKGIEIMGGSATLKSGITVRLKSVYAWVGARPNDRHSGMLGGALGPHVNGIHRVVVDREGKGYFGYDLIIQGGSESTGYVVGFDLPTHVDSILSNIAGNSHPAPLPLPKYPAPQIVRPGDIIELDLMVSADGKQKLTDFIEILARSREPAAGTTTTEPHDLTLDDGPVSFHAPITLLRQGQRVESTIAFTGKPGSTLWLGLPGQGRYILSLLPHEGFTRAGAVRDNVVSFRDGAQTYEIRFMQPIAGAGKAWNLYMMRDPHWTADIIKVSTGRLAEILSEVRP